MTGNDFAKRVSDAKQFFRKLLSSSAFSHFCLFLSFTAFGFLLTKSIIFSRFAPFAISLTASVPGAYLFFTAAGSILGYIFSSSLVIPARYVAAVAAVSVIRFALKDFKAVSRHPAFAPLTAFLSSASTGLTVFFVSNTVRGAAALYFAEALLCAGAAYFFETVFSSLLLPGEQSKRWEAFFASPAPGYSLLFLVFSLFLSFREVTFFNLSLSRILTGFVILLFARLGHSGAGAAAGIAAGVMEGLSSVGLASLSGAYAAAGFFAGVFRKAGNLLTALIYTLSVAVFSLQAASGSLSAEAVWEALLSSLLFLVFAPKITAVLKPYMQPASPAALLQDKLGEIASAVRGIPSRIEHITQNISPKNAPKENAFIKAVDQVCKVCQMRDICWGVRYNKSFDLLISTAPLLEQNDGVSESDIHEMFDGACLHEKEFTKCVNHFHNRFTLQKAAEERAQELRTLLSDQFVTVSDILEDTALCLSKETQSTEPPAFLVTVGTAQHVFGENTSRSSNQPCGDDFTFFELKDGKTAAVLSDGMGTGGHAAIDSALCTGTIRELLQAGLSPHAAVKIAGHAIMANAREESFATADIALFDPTDGALSLYKAGGCPTVILKKGEVLVSDLRSLPIGILGEVQLQTDKTYLSDGDLAVMLTDGALSVDLDVICEQVEVNCTLPPRELAEKLIEAVLSHRGDTRDDDISVAVLAISAVELD